MADNGCAMRCMGRRLRLADALVDQGCYQEAVGVLEAGEQVHPHSSELAGKLRDVRSLVTEQTYIAGLTQAAERSPQHDRMHIHPRGEMLRRGRLPRLGDVQDGVERDGQSLIASHVTYHST